MHKGPGMGQGKLHNSPHQPPPCAPPPLQPWPLAPTWRVPVLSLHQSSLIWFPCPAQPQLSLSPLLAPFGGATLSSLVPDARPPLCLCSSCPCCSECPFLSASLVQTLSVLQGHSQCPFLQEPVLSPQLTVPALLSLTDFIQKLPCGTCVPPFRAV